MSTAQVAPTVKYDFYQDLKSGAGALLNLYAQKEIAKASRPQYVAVEQAQTFGAPEFTTEAEARQISTAEATGNQTIKGQLSGLPMWGKVALGVTGLVVIGGAAKKAMS